MAGKAWVIAATEGGNTKVMMVASSLNKAKASVERHYSQLRLVSNAYADELTWLGSQGSYKTNVLSELGLFYTITRHRIM